MIIKETYMKTSKSMTLNEAVNQILRFQRKGRVSDFGSAENISGTMFPSIRVLEVEDL